MFGEKGMVGIYSVVVNDKERNGLAGRSFNFYPTHYGRKASTKPSLPIFTKETIHK